MKLLIIICSGFFLASCSSTPLSDRTPAQTAPANCNELAKSLFINENYEKNLEKALVDKKLITFKEKFILVQHPRLEWINKVKKSFNQSLRNWNNNRYPAFYLFSEEEILPTAKRYAENVEKIAANQVPYDDDQTTKAFLAVEEWIKAYKQYNTDIDQLIEERISLQYNLTLLKKLKLDKEPRDIQLMIKRAGEMKSEVLTLRKEDKNLQFTMRKLKHEMKELDGTLLRNGKIKDRIMRQAMLQDMLTILHREMEYASKNGFAGDALTKEMQTIAELIKQSEFSPVTFGVYKIQDKIFIRELMAASKLDVLYHKKDPVNRLATIVQDYFKNRKAGTDKEKAGFFKRLYAKITGITPKQAAIGGGTIAIAGLGAERYFFIKDSKQTELPDQSRVEELGPEDQAHLQQLENSEKVETEKHEGHSKVIEIQLEELLN